jgi:hypothetical protein
MEKDMPKKRSCCSFKKPKIDRDFPKKSSCCSFKKPKIDGDFPKKRSCCSFTNPKGNIPKSCCCFRCPKTNNFPVVLNQKVIKLTMFLLFLANIIINIDHGILPAILSKLQVDPGLNKI